MEISVHSLIALYQKKGDLHYEGEGVTQLIHAWQCGSLAKESGASKQLQLAAWLHDVGHLLSNKEGTPTTDGFDDRHEAVGGKYLSKIFPEAVFEPVLLHVHAKRYLVTSNPEYRNLLSPDSIRSLALQGGEMSMEESQNFLNQPFSQDAISLRRWDEIGKDSSLAIPNRDEMIEQLNQLVQECL